VRGQAAIGAIGLALWAGAAAAAPVPAGSAKAIRAFAGGNAFLPAFVPSGYRYTSWKKDSNVALPAPGQPWFEVHFAAGSGRLVWQVTYWSPDQPCPTLSVGQARVGSRTVYWSHVENGSSDAWTCVNTSDGKELRLDVFDAGPKLALAVERRIVASGTAA
jgi:hypothetical protein